MGNHLKRILSSIFFVALILGPLFVPDKRYAFALYAILGALTLREVFQLLRKDRVDAYTISGFIIYASLLLGIYDLVFMHQMPDYLPLLLAILVLLVFVQSIFSTKAQPMAGLASTLIAPAYVAASFLGISYFMEYRDDLPRLWLTISVFALIWINDSGAYLIGRKIGKTKLAPTISPNKTWEGSLAGVICAMLAAAGLSYLEGMPSAPIMIGFGAIAVVFGSLGDLLESRFKRAAGVKDSGVFLPGHGGFFDRFDAMMLAIPAAIIYFELALPKH